MVGDLEKPVWRNTLEIWRNVVGDLEKPIRRNTLEIWRNVVGDLENLFGENVGDLEKRGRRFGETCSAKTLEIWRNMAEQLWRSRVGVR